MSGLLDLSKPTDIVSYLAETPFACTQVEPISGGIVNYTFRLFLAQPSSMSRNAKTVVLKHARGWSRSNESFLLKVERQDIEAFALQHVRKFLPEPSSSLVTVPEVLLHDPAAHIIIMEDAGENSETLKALLCRTSLPAGNLDRLCEDLGRFLAIIHDKGSKDDLLMAKVNENEEMRRITAWITYERVVPMLKGDGNYQGLLHQPLVGPEGLSKSDMARLEAFTKRRMEQIYAAQDVFTMGDFWTGNVIVRLSESTGEVERAYVINWELTKPGIPFLDFGQLAAELYTIGCFHEGRQKEVEAGLRAYGTAYRSVMGSQVDESFVRGAGSHVGAHLVAVTPVVSGWGSKEGVREVVEEGARYILKGMDGDMIWLKSSAVAGLLSE